MTLEFVDINRIGKDIEKLKSLYERAFPLDERPPFNVLLEFNTFLFALYQDNEFVGLVDLVSYEDLLYIFFFAIEEKYRRQGIGTDVIKHLLKKYDAARIFLLAEELDEFADNYFERESRINFYTNNGLKVTNLVIDEFDVRYHVLTNHEDITPDDFKALMRYTIGEKNYKEYYEKRVSFHYVNK